MAVKKRCIFCRKHLREDGTCQNPECPRYTPKQEEQANEQGEQKETSQP
jgi:hypothetical protein